MILKTWPKFILHLQSRWPYLPKCPKHLILPKHILIPLGEFGITCVAAQWARPRYCSSQNPNIGGFVSAEPVLWSTWLCASTTEEAATDFKIALLFNGIHIKPFKITMDFWIEVSSFLRSIELFIFLPVFPQMAKDAEQPSMYFNKPSVDQRNTRFTHRFSY